MDTDETSQTNVTATNVVPPATENTSVNTSFGHPLSSVLTVKLDQTNYSLRGSMVLAILKGQKVDEVVLGTKTKPCEFLVLED